MDFNAGYYQGIMQNTGDVSFVVKGQFPNSILLSWVIYDANGQIYSAVNDQELTPDVGNVNPFLPGVDVLAANRSYTAFFMPEGAVAPEGIAASNVLTLPPVSTSDRIYITMRSYWSQPGYPRVGGPTPTIQAVSAADPTQPATCPGLGLDEDLFPLAPFTIPTPESGRILFFRPPNHIIPMADGTKTAEPNGCTGYGMAQLSDTDLNVIKLHKVPLLGPRSDIAMNDLKQQADGSALLVTIPRPSDLSAKERLALLEKARANNWNIMPSAGEGAQVAPFLTYRNKLADASFPYSITAIPCFGSDLGEWSEATIDYASSAENMGEYYIDGVICTIDEVLDDSCVQQLANE
jgi:hypothetical protein